jgi:hypothetical protein
MIIIAKRTAIGKSPIVILTCSHDRNAHNSNLHRFWLNVQARLNRRTSPVQLERSVSGCAIKIKCSQTFGRTELVCREWFKTDGHQWNKPKIGKWIDRYRRVFDLLEAHGDSKM